MPHSTPNKIVDALRSELSHLLNLNVAILYGSAAKGALRAESDVDVAVLFANPLSASRRMELAGRFQACLGRPVDLVDLAGVNGVLLKQILSTGRVLVRNDVAAYERLLQRMIYNQTDMMPYVRHALHRHAERFAHV